MMPVTKNAASLKTSLFVPPIPVPSSVIPIDLSDIISPSIINNKVFPQQVSCHKKQSSQAQPKYEVADIFNLYGDEYRRNHKLTTDQLNVMYAICHCRTAEYGFHADVCDNCGHIETAYNSCRNRHCPKCQGIAKRKWVEVRIDELLPVAYHHATFTLPNQISVLSLHNQKLIYDLLFNAASQTLLVFGDDPKWLGAKIGFYGILHTWSQTLWPHVHPHFIVPAGGLTDDGKWIEPKYKGKFLFPVKALSKVFRGKFIEGLKKAYYAGELALPDNLKIKDDDEFEQWINLLVSKNWVVNSKPPFSGPEEVVRYIGRYTHRIAISNHRIISIADGQIRFSYKDNKEKDKSKMWKEMVLPADQFIERFLWHVLPKRYHRIRHYGFLNNGEKHANLETIREFFKTQESVEELAEVITTDDADGITCPKCEKGRLRPFLVTDRYNQILKFDLSVFLKKEARDTS
jgi:predicted Zn-ribbon and HTH transcriptional regulator